MNGAPHDDALLLTRLRQGLEAATVPAGSEALEERVLAQWRQRHSVAAPATAGGAAALRPPHGMGRRPLWLASGALLLAALLLTTLASWQRPDPALDELMQLDVLSEMALGEM